MHGERQADQAKFCHISPEGLVPRNNPLGFNKKMVDTDLKNNLPEWMRYDNLEKVHSIQFINVFRAIPATTGNPDRA